MLWMFTKSTLIEFRMLSPAVLCQGGGEKSSAQRVLKAVKRPRFFRTSFAKCSTVLCSKRSTVLFPKLRKTAMSSNHALAVGFLAALALTMPAVFANCYKNSDKAIGGRGEIRVPFKLCSDVNARLTTLDGRGNGKFCIVPEVTGCYKNGERARGQAHFPAVHYKPCCESNAKLVTVAGSWGKFCAAPGQTVTAAPPVVGKRAEGKFCSDHCQSCAAGLFCRAEFGKGGRNLNCSPRLARGTKCAAATEFVVDGPAVRSRAPQIGGVSACAAGLTCQWRGTRQESADGKRFRRIYECHPEQKTGGELYAEIDSDIASDCGRGFECEKNGERVLFGRCYICCSCNSCGSKSSFRRYQLTGPG